MGKIATAEGSTPATSDRKRLVGTSQQEAFWAELQDGTANVVLEARAGTGKSTSCREGMYRLLDRKSSLAIRYCCFNKAIADEFAEKCPGGVEVGTMHRFGLLALPSAQIVGDKTYTLLDGMSGGKDLKRYIRKAIASLVSLAKNHALRPGDPANPHKLHQFIDVYDVEVWNRPDLVVSWADRVLIRSAQTTNIINFDDMLWLPVLLQPRFPSVDYLFIDEVQDLNPVQHEMAALLAGSGRTIVVGDPFQAIYGWRGADVDSMDRLRQQLDAKTMPLTITFRCPRSHVELARRLVPDFEAAPDAPEGILNETDEIGLEQVQPGDMVLCRANAPIVSACLRSITRRVPAVVRGRAIGDQLGHVVARFGDVATIPEFTRSLNAWRSMEIARLESRDGTDHLIEQTIDKANCLDAIASSCSSPSEIPGVIRQLFDDGKSADRITYSSVHRAKGSEAERVAYIQVPYSEKRDRDRPPQPWELDQRRNLRYIALTRSMDELTIVTPSGKGA